MAVLLLLPLIPHIDRHSPSLQLAYVALTSVISFIMVRYAMQKLGVTMAGIGVDKLRLKYAGWALAGFVLYFVSYIILLQVLSTLIPDLPTDQEQELGFDKQQTRLGLLIVFMTLVVLPPLIEEFIMRGFFYTGLRRSLNVLWSVLIVSTLFGAAHLLGGKDGSTLWVGAIDTFVLSTVLCQLREKTGSFWPGVGVHFIKNGLAFTVLFIFIE